jgi:hypothetical protein
VLPCRMKQGRPRRASFEPVFGTKITESPPNQTPTARDRTTHRIVNIGHVLQLFLARATESGLPPSGGEDVRSSAAIIVVPEPLNGS